MLNTKKKLYIIAGPTAVGKTDISLELAKRIDGEIISADSMQVYRGMDIGTAKLALEDRQGIRHHLIDILSPFDDFNIAIFQELAKKAIADIYERGKTPIIVGGTGFYIQAVLYDIEFNKEEENDSLRKSLYEEYELKGANHMHEKLAELDRDAADKIHPNNKKRLIRAIEYILKNSEKISEHNTVQSQKESVYDYRYFVLNMDRAKLYERINQRVDIMIRDGLPEEVRGLKEASCHAGMVSMKGIAYKELLEYLDEKISYEEAVDMIKQHTRNFAKRQLTWFKREEEAIWIDVDKFNTKDDILKYMLSM